MTKQDIIALGQQLSEEANAAHDLWSWLPSRKVAEKHHGDYATEFQPSVADVMREAAMYVAYLGSRAARIGYYRDHTAEEKEWFMRCPCGGNHDGATP